MVILRSYRKAIAKLMNRDLKYYYYGNKKKRLSKNSNLRSLKFSSLESFKLKESKPIFFQKKGFINKIQGELSTEIMTFSLVPRRWKETTLYLILYRN